MSGSKTASAWRETGALRGWRAGRAARPERGCRPRVGAQQASSWREPCHNPQLPCSMRVRLWHRRWSGRDRNAARCWSVCGTTFMTQAPWSAPENGLQLLDETGEVGEERWGALLVGFVLREMPEALIALRFRQRDPTEPHPSSHATQTANPRFMPQTFL